MSPYFPHPPSLLAVIGANKAAAVSKFFISDLTYVAITMAASVQWKGGWPDRLQRKSSLTTGPTRSFGSFKWNRFVEETTFNLNGWWIVLVRNLGKVLILWNREAAFKWNKGLLNEDRTSWGVILKQVNILWLNTNVSYSPINMMSLGRSFRESGFISTRIMWLIYYRDLFSSKENGHESFTMFTEHSCIVLVISYSTICSCNQK